MRGGFGGSAAVTSLGEADRQLQGALGATSLHEQTRTVLGIVHKWGPEADPPESAQRVQAHQIDGSPIVSEEYWIQLIHSAQEIAEKWGTVRVGFKLSVTIVGPGSGQSASGSIIGGEDCNLDETVVPNEAEQGLYAIFAPGTGVG